VRVLVLAGHRRARQPAEPQEMTYRRIGAELGWRSARILHTAAPAYPAFRLAVHRQERLHGFGRSDASEARVIVEHFTGCVVE